MPPQVPYRQHQRWANWGETAHCSPEFTFYPRSVEDLEQIVHFARATGRKIRVAATGHSWSALVPTDEILVSIRHFNRVTMDLSNASQPRITVESGATVKEVNDVLEAHGCALPLNVVLESVRFGGLIATGSHGSGWNNPTLSDLVSSVEMIDAAGELRKFEMGIDSDEVMNAVRLNLGLLGIIYRVTLQVQKTWHVRAVDHRLPIEHVLDHLQEWVPAHESMDVFWWPFCEQFWVKSWDRVDAEITDKPRKRVGDRMGAATSSRIAREAFKLVNAFPSLTPAFCQTVFSATPSEQEKTVEIVEAIHYRRALDVVKMGCVEIAFKVDPTFQNVKWAIQVVREMTGAYAARGEYPLNVTMNVRFIQNSQCWLSPAFGGGHTCYIEILSSQ
ncbi:MAG TPA: FAD-binding protein, partial [Ktedonobacteraceae bacterium]